MATNNSIHNLVFEELAYIQASLDEFSNRHDNSKPLPCRALLKDRSRRCQNNGWLQDQHAKVEELFVEFKSMTKCPETDILYKKLEIFITYTYCKRHVEVALESFREWTEQQILAASSSPPISPSISPSASPVSSPASSPPSSTTSSPFSSPSSSSEDIFFTPFDERADTMSPKSLSDGPIFAEPESDSEAEGVVEILMKRVTEDTKDKSTPIQHINAKIHIPVGGQGNGYRIASLGDVIPPKRALSLRNETAIMKAMNEYPTDSMVQEGTVYVLQHIKIQGLFKIGYSKVGAPNRLRQSRNCYRKNTELIYETKKQFRGAQQAEKLIQASLIHYKLRVKNCEQCGKGHVEWFKAPRKQLFKTIESIEAFIQLPAYVEENGKWTFSAKGYEAVKTMFHFDPSSLLGNRYTGERKSQRLAGGKDETDEGPALTLPLRQKEKQRESLVASLDETVVSLDDSVESSLDETAASLDETVSLDEKVVSLDEKVVSSLSETVANIAISSEK
ncbi:hypothetical protein GGI35DRAFT_439283 [Trichoderma velutinum]